MAVESPTRSDLHRDPSVGPSCPLVHTTEPDNLRGIPLGRIRAACTMRGAGGIVLAIAMRIDEEIASSELSTRPPGGAAIERRYVLQRPAGKILGDDFYRDVAHAYESCVALGLSPNKTIATDVGVQISSVAASVNKARRLKYLPPGERGEVTA